MWRFEKSSSPRPQHALYLVHQGEDLSEVFHEVKGRDRVHRGVGDRQRISLEVHLMKHRSFRIAPWHSRNVRGDQLEVRPQFRYVPKRLSLRCSKIQKHTTMGNRSDKGRPTVKPGKGLQV